MQFEYSEPQTDFEKLLGGYFYVNAFGSIDQGDDQKFQEFLKNHRPPPRLTIYIDSIGGHVETAMAIGRIIRGGWHSTAIGQNKLDPYGADTGIAKRKFVTGHCYSAATLLFIAGRLRYYSIGSKFGVHQFSFKNPSPSHVGLSQVLSAKIANYVTEMGIAPEFLEISSTTPSEQLALVDEPTLQRLNVVTGGQTDVRWTVQARNNILYVRGERDSMWGHHKVMLCYAKSVGFTFWSVIEAQGREDQLTKFGLVEIVLNGEAERIDISTRCTRGLFGSYVNVFSPISQDEARRIAYSDSFGLQIRLTTDAPVFLGVAAVSTDGGKDQLATFYEALSANG